MSGAQACRLCVFEHLWSWSWTTGADGLLLHRPVSFAPAPAAGRGVQEGRLPRVLEVTVLSSVTRHPRHTRHACPGWQKGGTAAHPPACKFRAFIRLPAVVASWGPISGRGLSGSSWGGGL